MSVGRAMELRYIKAAMRSELARRWSDFIDFDAGRIKPWSDTWGIHNAITLFNPAPVA
jgi:galactarate dehydratase